MRRLLREVALSVGAIAGLLGIALAVASLVFGLRPTVVTSGSMAPAFDTGALVWTRAVDADELRVGDVVTVDHPDGGRVTHRVAEISGTGDERMLTLRGDANAGEDPQVYVVAEVERVVASLDGAGTVLVWLSSPAGAVVSVASVVTLLTLAFRPGHRDATPGRTSPNAGRSIVVTGVVVALVASTVAVGIGSVAPSRAAWTDQAVASTGGFSAHTVQAPAAPGCTDEGGLLGILGYVSLRWTHLDARYAYRYSVIRVSDGAVVGGGDIAPTGGPGSTQVFELRSSLLNGVLLGTANFDVRIWSTLNGSSWTSVTSEPTRVHSVSVVLGLSLRCGQA